MDFGVHQQAVPIALQEAEHQALLAVQEAQTEEIIVDKPGPSAEILGHFIINAEFLFPLSDNGLIGLDLGGGATGKVEKLKAID